MFLRVWQTLTVALAALAMGASFTHVLEYPAKLHYDRFFYAAVNGTLYGAFGLVGGVLFVGAIIAGIVLVILQRRSRPAVWWTLSGTAFLVAALIAWSMIVAPVNARVADAWHADQPEGVQKLRPESYEVPGPEVVNAWSQLRTRWEYGHIVTFALLLAGLTSLTWSAGSSLVRREDEREVTAPSATSI